MHEVSLADAIVTIASDHAQGRRVLAVEVRVGYLRQVLPEALEFLFELMSRGTVVEGASLELVHVPACVRCRSCGAESEVSDFPLACTECAGVDIDVVAGDELTVESVELDEPLLVAGR